MLTFAVPAALFGLLAIPAWILLHRRRRSTVNVDVAGTFLWRRAVREAGRRPRMSADALLALRLLLWTLLVVAASGPAWSTQERHVRVAVLDRSASMGAVDGASSHVARGREGVDASATRFDVGLATIESWIRDGDTVVVVLAGTATEVVVTADTTPDAAIQALRTLVPVDGTADLAEAARVARALARANAPALLHWFSDEAPPGGAGWTHHPLAGDGRNVGITGLEFAAGQMWVRVSSNDPSPVQVPVRAFLADVEVGRTEVLVPARGDATATLPWLPDVDVASVRLDPPVGDAVTIDDVAFVAPRTITVVLDAEDPTMLRALRALPDVDVRVVDPAVVATVPADVRIVRRETAKLFEPSGPTVILPDVTDQAVAAITSAWVRSDPVLRFVDLAELVVAYVPWDVGAWDYAAGDDDAVEPSTAASSPTADPWRILARGEVVASAANDVSGPAPGDEAPETAMASVALMRWRDLSPAQGDGFVLDLAFHPARGDFGVRVAFPAWITNVVDAVRGSERLTLGTSLPAGSTLNGVAAERADRPGIYSVEGRTLATAPVDAREARLPRRDESIEWDPAFVAPPVAADLGPGVDEPARARWSSPSGPIATALWITALIAAWAEAWASVGRRERPWIDPIVQPIGRYLRRRFSSVGRTSTRGNASSR